MQNKNRLFFNNGFVENQGDIGIAVELGAMCLDNICVEMAL